MEKLGLIAGNKRFPIIFSQAAKKNNYFVVAVAIKKDTSLAIKKAADKVYWLNLNEFSRMFEIFKNEGIVKIAMAGQISPYRLFSKEVNTNKEIQEVLTDIQDKRADTIFAAIAQRLNNAGFQLISSTKFLEEMLPEKGVLTKRGPTSSEEEDIGFGFVLAKAVADLDIGQTIAVKKKAVVAVEALEGTDNLIRRAGKIAQGEIVVVKVSKPKQDTRFDVPVIGFNTVKALIKAGVSCLAIEAGKTLFIDQEPSIRLADKKGIAIVAV